MYTYDGMTNPMCLKSTVITLGGVSKEAIVEVVSDEYCCAEGNAMTDLILIMACPEI